MPTQENHNRMPRLRTLSEVYTCIKEEDPGTAVTENYLRTLVVSGTVPCIKCGKKYLVDLDILIDHLRIGQALA